MNPAARSSRPSDKIDSMEDAPIRSVGRPKDLAKRDAILSAAAELFLESGFPQANMQDVANRAGVSKLTLYNHFGDKAALLTAAVRRYYDTHLPESIFMGWRQEFLREDLQQFARAYLAYLLMPASIAARRLLRSPDMPPVIAAEVWNIGPRRIEVFVAANLVRFSEAGVLRIGDAAMAAVHLLTLIRGDHFAQLGYGVERHPPGEETEAYLAGAIGLFLRGYARVPEDW